VILDYTTIRTNDLGGEFMQSIVLRYYFQFARLSSSIFFANVINTDKFSGEFPNRKKYATFFPLFPTWQEVLWGAKH